MRLVWAVIPLLLFGIVGVYDVDARPMDRFGIVDMNGDSLDEVKTGEQVQIIRDAIIRDRSSEYYPIPPECEVKDLEIKCFDNTKQVTIIFQIKDEDGKVEQISWLEGELQPNIFKTVSSSWIPQKSGIYTVTSFIWTSINNPIIHALPTSVTIQVTDDVNSTKFDISTPISKITELNLASPVEFVDDGREIQRSILQKSPAPSPMYDKIMNSMDDGVSVSSTGVASITSPIHEKYSVNTGIGFYAEDWMPKYIPDGQKLLYTETTCYEKTGNCGLGIHFVPTTFVLHENVTSYDLQFSKGFFISVKYSALPLDDTEDIIEYVKESRESQSGNYGGFVEMTRDGKTVSAYEGGNDYNHYHTSLYFYPDDHMGVGVSSNYLSLDELIPIFESVMGNN